MTTEGASQHCHGEEGWEQERRYGEGEGWEQAAPREEASGERPRGCESHERSVDTQEEVLGERELVVREPETSSLMSHTNYFFLLTGTNLLSQTVLESLFALVSICSRLQLYFFYQ